MTRLFIPAMFRIPFDLKMSYINSKNKIKQEGAERGEGEDKRRSTEGLENRGIGEMRRRIPTPFSFMRVPSHCCNLL